MEQRTVLVIDDEQPIVEILKFNLSKEGYSVLEAFDGAAGLELALAKNPDLILLELMLPKMDGFEVCRKIREKHYFPVIMLTAKIEETDKINGIMLGADDYITKPFQPLELLARIKGQLRRAEFYNKGVSDKVEETCYEIRGLEVNENRHQAFLYGEKLDLTPTEFEILLYLCRHLNQVVTSEELFENVWKEKYLENNNTVFVHVCRIREKMHENTRKPKFVKTVWGVGYKLEE